MRPRPVTAALVGAALVAPAVALGAQQQLVVLRFSGKASMEGVLDSATERAATAALRVSAGRHKIVTRDMLAAIVGEEKLLKCEADARCELDLGVGLGTGYMLAGSIRKVGAGVELAVKLYDVRNLDLLAQETEAAAREDDLLGRVGPIVERVMRTGLALGASAGGQPAAGGGSFQEEGPALAVGGGTSEVTVSFESAPEGAVVRVDGELLCAAAPCRKRIAAGAHKVVFEKERYAPATQNFTAAKGAVVKGTLAPRFGWVSVETTPSGIGISIDGADAGKSAIAWREVDPGTVEVAISDPCWLRGGERVTVTAGERKLLKLAAKPRTAGLRVNAEDEKGNAVDGEVKLDGEPAGATGEVLKVPLCAKKVLVLLGKETFEAELKLEEGKVTVVAAKPRVSVASGGMVRLPGGTFKMGERGDTVTVKPFELDVTAVTLAAYEACVKAGPCWAPDTGEFCNWGKADRANHPVNCVDWNQATAYCNWAKKRLPTDEEREWAARGAERGTRYPWGHAEPADQLCWNGGSVQRYAKRLGTCAVGSFPGGDSPQGLKDLAGNVWEWTSTAYDSSTRVLRGGFWGGGYSWSFAAAFRDRFGPAVRDDVVGFRCARSP